MTPKNQHVCCIKSCFAQSLLGVIQTRRFHAEPRLFLEVSGNTFTQKLFTIRLFLLWLLLVPNKHSDSISRLRLSEEGEGKSDY